MKFLVLLLLLGSWTAWTADAQRIREEIAEEEAPFVAVKTLPQFPGGAPAMDRFIDSVKRYPAIYADVTVNAVIPIQCHVEKDGSLTELVVLRSLDSQLDEAAVQVVRQMPNWIPAMDHGETVRMKIIIPVKF